jgi:hypothetical protein
MTGTVTDPSGAAVPGSTVTLKNASNGFKLTVTTNATGFYRFSEIPPGQGYEAVFTAPGFAPLEIKNIYLTVATVRTQNATLAIGGATEVVQVSAASAEVTINTTDATIGNTFDVEQLNSLPVQQRNDPTALFKLQPGVNDTGSVTGARVDQNYITLDGLDVNDFATGSASQTNTGSGINSGFENSIVGHAPIDSVEEFHGTVGGNQAATGAGGGGQFQLVTKSGTNKFHGNLNEYHRDPSTVANSWFNNNASPKNPRNHLIENQFGGNIGGPIKKDKLFFFFDYNNSKIVSSIDTYRTVPLDNFRAGNIGYLDSTSTPTVNSVSYLSPAGAQALDPAGIGEDSTWLGVNLGSNGSTYNASPNYTSLNARFPHSNASGGDGVNSGGYTFNAPNNDDETNYVGRVDYTLNQSMKLFARFTIVRENAVENPNEFAGDPPTNPIIDRSYAFAIGHTWLIGENKTNRLTLGETVQKLQFPNTNNPEGSTFYTFGDGTGNSLTSSLYLNPSFQARRVPIPVLGDDFSWTKGGHTWQWGGTFKDILTHNTSGIDYNAVEIGPGGNMFALEPSLRPGSTYPNGGIYVAPTTNATKAEVSLQDNAEYTFDQAYTASLGRIAEISADFNYNAAGTALKQLTGDQRMYRYYQTQLYISDQWKATPSLTVAYGLTYQWFSVPYETRGLESVEPFSFDQYFQARLLQSSEGLTGPNAVPLITYYRGGKGAGNDAPPLYQPQHKNIAPHIGFNYNPGFDKKMVINGGVSLIYDRTVVNAIQLTQDQDSYLFQQSEPISEGVSGDPSTSLLTGPRVDTNNNISTVTITPPASPLPPYQPFVSGGAPYGLQAGSAFNATIDPTLKTPYSIVFNFGVQRSFKWDLVLKASYAGRLGRRLLAQADANQIIDFPDLKSGQFLSQAFSAVTAQLRAGILPSAVTPQPWFEDIMGGTPPPLSDGTTFTSFTEFLASQNYGQALRGDFGDTVQFLSLNGNYVNGNPTGAPLNVGSAAQFSENTFFGNKGFSTYHALLLTLQKNLSHGLQFDLNYTFSHSIDNVSLFANSSGDTGIGGIGLVCDVVRPRECRANSDFDIKQVLSGDATYQLPFGKGRMFLPNPSRWLNELIGGWDLSGITEWHTGQAWGTNSNAFVASYSNDAPGILVGSKSAVATHVTKFSAAAGGGVNIFANQANAQNAYEGPIGFRIGARNGLRGPNFFNEDMGLGKVFPIDWKDLNLRFRADAFNVFNHPNFSMPAENGYNGYDQQDFTSPGFGQISSTVTPEGNLNNGARVLQLSLRLEF